MARIYDLPSFVGRRFGRLSVTGVAGPGVRGRSMFHCRCECGIEKVVTLKNLLSGKTQSCGCLFVERRRNRHSDAAALVIASGVKRCSKCKETKAVSEFGARSARANRTGLCSWCFDCWRDNHLRRVFGISLRDMKSMIESQGGTCAVTGCGTVVDASSPVDHCHESGQVRGILCTPCNTSLGRLGESVRRIEGLAAYARQWKQLRLIAGGKTA